MRNADHEFELGAYGTCERCGEEIHGLRSEIDAEDIKALRGTAKALRDHKTASVCESALAGSKDAFRFCERMLRQLRAMAQQDH
jgi:hypothetical protein